MTYYYLSVTAENLNCTVGINGFPVLFDKNFEMVLDLGSHSGELSKILNNNSKIKKIIQSELSIKLNAFVRVTNHSKVRTKFNQRSICVPVRKMNSGP